MTANDQHKYSKWLTPRLTPVDVVMFLHKKPILESLRVAAQNISGRVLDVGCGIKPYSKIINCTSYVGVEHAEAVNPEVSPDATFDGVNLPFDDQEFDSALCTDVIEHAKHPVKLVKETARVLKPGGYLFITAPMTIHHHEEPHDFRRYTFYGMTELLEENGFEIIWLHDRGKMLTVLASLVSSSVSYLVSKQPFRLLLQLGVFPLILLLLVLDKLLKADPTPVSLGWQALALKR